MVDYTSKEAAGDGSKPTVKRSAAAFHAAVRRSVATFVCSAAVPGGVGGAAAGSRLMLPKIPKGAKAVSHRLTTSTNLGGVVTLAIGIVGNTGKYRTAAVAPAADTPTSTAKASILAADELAADEQQFITTAAAALPNAGELITVETFYTLAGS